MSRAIALILTDLEQTRFGLPSATTEQLAGQSILEHTIGRVAKIHSIRSIVLVHPQGQDPLALVKGRKFGKSLAAYADPAGLWDWYLPMRQAARKWAMTSWRGGLWGATCFDELLAAGICREQARGVLPQNLYTEYYGTANLNNFIPLRILKIISLSQLIMNEIIELPPVYSLSKIYF